MLVDGEKMLSEGFVKLLEGCTFRLGACDQVPIYAPETFRINLDGKVETLYDHIIPRISITQSKNIFCHEIGIITGKPITVHIKTNLGNIYYDTDKDDDSIVGHYNGLYFMSTCPGLIDPKMLKDKCRPMCLEEASKIDSHIRREQSYMPKDRKSVDVMELMDYMSQAKDRIENKKITDNVAFLFNYIGVTGSFYNYLDRNRVD